MNVKKRFSAVAAAIAMALVLAACGSGSSASAKGGTLTLGAFVPPTTFAANGASWVHEAPYLQAAYDTLVRANPSGDVVPWLATKWSYDVAKTVLTMTLRNDVTFTDGTKFDASAAAKNLLRFRDGTSPYKSALAKVTGAEAVDPTTLRITLSAPEPGLVYSLTQSAGLMESPKHFGAPDEKTNPVGSGPYKLDTGGTVGGSKYVFTKNTTYWAPQDQHYDQVVVGVYATQAAVNALQAGQIDGAIFAKSADVDPLKAAGLQVKTAQQSWLGLNLYDRKGKLAPPLGDVRVRRAIAYAVNRDDMLKTVGGYGAVTGQIFAPDTPGYDKTLDGQYPHDPAKAKQLMAEAGYPNGFTLKVPTPQGIGVTAQSRLLVQQLDAIGVKVENVPTAANDYISDLLGAKYAAVAQNLVLIGKATFWYATGQMITPDATWNPFHVQDPQVVSLLDTMKAGPGAAADAAEKQLNKYLVDQVWFVPFFRQDSFYVVGKKTDVELQSDNSVPYLYNFRPKN